MNHSQLELYLDDPGLREVIDAGGESNGDFLIVSGMPPALIGYWLPIIRALHLNGFNVHVYCYPTSGEFLRAACFLVHDLSFEVHSEFNKKWDAQFLYQNWLPPYRHAMSHSRPRSYFARLFPDCSVVSSPYMKGSQSHIFLEYLAQCEITVVPPGLRRPLEVNWDLVQHLMKEASGHCPDTFKTDFIDTIGFSPVATNAYFPGFEQQITSQKFVGYQGRDPEDYSVSLILARFLVSKSVTAPFSFPVLFRLLCSPPDAKTYIMPPFKPVPKGEQLSPQVYSHLDLSQMTTDFV